MACLDDEDDDVEAREEMSLTARFSFIKEIMIQVAIKKATKIKIKKKILVKFNNYFIF